MEATLLDYRGQMPTYHSTRRTQDPLADLRATLQEWICQGVGGVCKDRARICLEVAFQPLHSGNPGSLHEEAWGPEKQAVRW